MSRFDRQATEGGDLPALLGTATEEFRRSLERHVQQIVEAANGQAAEIERDAERSAREKEQELDLRSQELVKGVITRASSVLDSIELVQSAISGMLAELRAEVKALESGKSGEPAQLSPSTKSQTIKPQSIVDPRQDQRQAEQTPPQPTPPRVAARPVEAPGGTPAEPTPEKPVEARTPLESRRPAPEERVEQPSPPTPQATQAGQSQESAPASVPADEAKPGALIERAPVEPKSQQDRRTDSSAEFDQMIHGEIRRMFHSGKSREDVEGFLGRFELGDTYLGLLDELYSEKDPSGRRRIFGRRRDR